ncbi:Hydrolase (HAD superfamily) [Caldisalinibacter kiritimatiensis]|uniref:Hydrolase (HAD superfamily) n=1 Tax=Caldisalinibacter kiritimatiensis TaxID=1304284 RepID=R1ARZ6_9FIRM|nr:Cof-type HAD-IIB family hydrolase [Caldisalinibacter kiritimatiensis]EOC99912.1 Hydrolase (HAD superfamily) [Caldisalinibacter kiritimatiensis]
MNYKLIAIDMDGTLLNSNKEISERNKKALKVATEKGVQVVISTGRIFTSARYYAKLLGLITPIISCNGAYVCEYHRKNVLYENPMETVDFKEIIKTLQENDFYYHFYDNENFYTRELNYSSSSYYNWNKKQKPGDRINIEIIDNPMELVEEKELKIYKIVAVDKDREKLDYIRKVLSKNKNIEIVSSWSDNIEIMNKGVSKGKALEKLCKIYNISKEQVIAIGDNYNDIPMLEFAGTAVAMGNGEEDAKKIADIVTDTNDNDGVAKAIEELIF